MSTIIDQFKYLPSPSPFLPPGVRNKNRLLNGVFNPPTTDESKRLLQKNRISTNTCSGQSIDGDDVVGDGATKKCPLGLVPQAAIHARITDLPFEDQPALERSAERSFVVDTFLETWDPDRGEEDVAGPSTDTVGGFNVDLSDEWPPSPSMLGAGLPVLDVNTRLRQLAEEDDELAGNFMEGQETSGDVTKKRKRSARKSSWYYN